MKVSNYFAVDLLKVLQLLFVSEFLLDFSALNGPKKLVKKTGVLSRACLYCDLAVISENILGMEI